MPGLRQVLALPTLPPAPRAHTPVSHTHTCTVIHTDIPRAHSCTTHNTHMHTGTRGHTRSVSTLQGVCARACLHTCVHLPRGTRTCTTDPCTVPPEGDLPPRLAPGAAGTSSSSRGRFFLTPAWSWERGPAVLLGERSWQTHRAASFLRRGPQERVGGLDAALGGGELGGPVAAGRLQGPQRQPDLWGLGVGLQPSGPQGGLHSLRPIRVHVGAHSESPPPEVAALVTERPGT